MRISLHIGTSCCRSSEAVTLSELLELAKTEDGKRYLRVMLAELAGWANVVRASLDCWEGAPPVGHHNHGIGHEQIPNFPSDLNACHEVSASLGTDDKYRFSETLFGIHGGSYGPDGEIESHDAFHATIDATAAQRTIALICDATEGMTHKQLKSYAASFRRGLLGRRASTDMCFMATAPLTPLLQMAGVACELVEGKCYGHHHFFIRLADGTIVDPTADQFGRGLPKVYVGPMTDVYTTQAPQSDV